MCLYSKINVPIKLNEDKTCYKVLKCCGQKKDGTILYCTPYYRRGVEESVINGDELMVAEGRPMIVYDKNNDVTEISSGFIHTYQTIEEAQCVVYELSVRNPYEDIAIFQCSIPKNTEFYSGKIGGANIYTYASPSIRFDKLIKTIKLI